MFMEIAIGAIGIGVVLMVGYLVVAQIRASLQTSLDSTTLNAGNKSQVNAAMVSTQGIVFAGFGLIAVGIIVLAAFGLINIFK
jgi:hypothetical protein